MKTTILSATCFLASLIGSALSAHAETLTVKVPFEFTAGAKAMPAGEYSFTVDTAGVLLVRGMASGLSGALVAVQADSPATPLSFSAEFDRSAKGNALARITLPSGSAYLVLTAPSKRSSASLPLTESSVLLSRH